MKRTALALLVVCGFADLARADSRPAPAPGFQVALDSVRHSLAELKSDCARPGADAPDCARTVPQAERLLAEAESAQKAGQGGQALERLRQSAQLVREGLARSRRRALSGTPAPAKGRAEALAALRRVKDEVTRLLETLKRCCDATPGKKGEKACERSHGEAEVLLKRSDTLAAEGKVPQALEALREAAALTRRSTAECERQRSAARPPGVAR